MRCIMGCLHSCHLGGAASIFIFDYLTRPDSKNKKLVELPRLFTTQPLGRIHPRRWGSCFRPESAISYSSHFTRRCTTS